MTRCTERTDEFHTADTTIWFRLAYGTPLPLWRVIPHRWVTRPCDAWRTTVNRADTRGENEETADA